MHKKIKFFKNELLNIIKLTQFIKKFNGIFGPPYSRNSLTNLRNFSIIKFPTRLQNYTRGCEKNCLTSNDRFRVQNARRD